MGGGGGISTPQEKFSPSRFITQLMVADFMWMKLLSIE